MKILEEKDNYIIVTYDDLKDKTEEWFLAECYLIKNNNNIECTSCYAGNPYFEEEIKKYLGGKGNV